MLKIKQSLNDIKTNTRARQVMGLFSVNMITIPIGIVTSIVITKYLGAKGFGDYKFIQSIFNFAVIITTLGFFQAGNRALVLNSDKQIAKEFYGTELIITGAIFLIMSMLLLSYALLDKNIQEKQLDKFLLFVIPFGWIYLLNRFFETLFQADNQIRKLGEVRLYPQIGFLITALLIYFVFNKHHINHLAIVYGLYLLTGAIVYTIILIKLNISFKNFKIRFQELLYYNKKFGFNVYLGALIGIGFIQLTEILISYFGVDNSGVGYYSLALSFALPLSFIPNTIATTHYKDFSTYRKVPRKLLQITVLLSLIALIGLWVLVPPFIKYFYSVEFINVIWLNFIVSFGVLAHGLGDFFNRYLGANGQGEALRNSAFLVGLSILMFNLILIPKWGENGAAYARLASGIIYLLLMLIFYLRYIRNKKENSY